MEQIGATEVLFIAGFGPIVRNTEESHKLYGRALGISFKEETGGYLHTGNLKGAKEFALWPLSQARSHVLETIPGRTASRPASLA